ncbi:MAG: L-fucose mutarotase [Nocardioidaceae bacterium]|nr:L-fucose mutarotase [Nocardioidaceae bacterium]
MLTSRAHRRRSTVYSMLKNLNPLLTGELLGLLQDMGHGDVVAIVDRNYPAVSTARHLVRLSGTSVNEAATAVLSVLPVDTFVEPAVFRMGAVGAESSMLDVHRDFGEILDAAEGRPVPVEPLERFEFYRRAREAFVVIATTEDRPYGCFLVTKGVI